MAKRKGKETGRSSGPRVEITHFADLTQLVSAQPDIERLSVLTRGNIMEWPSKFRLAMREVCVSRALSEPIPAQIRIAAIPNRGLLLLWPTHPADPDGFAVHVSPAGRRISADLTEAFAVLGIDLPPEVVVAVPATHYLHPTHGLCLALHLRSAEFLPERSRTAAGRMAP
ncbi:MAG: hypothetical protein ACOY93_05245 [Bacillota bacterium]